MVRVACPALPLKRGGSKSALAVPALRWRSPPVDNPNLRALVSRVLATSFVRFCVIGGVGFVVDCAVLLALMHWASADALAARLVSFACAVLVTFDLNRRWTFRDAAPRPFLVEFLAYLGIQGFGFVCNFGIYAACYFALRPSQTAPLVSLAIASAGALLVNYAGARFLVFRPGR